MSLDANIYFKNQRANEVPNILKTIFNRFNECDIN